MDRNAVGTLPSDEERCVADNAKGSRCKRYRWRDSEYCPAHFKQNQRREEEELALELSQPLVVSEKNAARILMFIESPQFRLEDADDVVSYLFRLIMSVRGQACFELEQFEKRWREVDKRRRELAGGG